MIARAAPHRTKKLPLRGRQKANFRRAKVEDVEQRGLHPSLLLLSFVSYFYPLPFALRNFAFCLSPSVSAALLDTRADAHLYSFFVRRRLESVRE
jgi:hypothetical protein